MRRLALNDVVRRIVSVALASAVGAAAFACATQDEAAVPALDFDAGRALVDGADPAFADESTFACEQPLPSVLEQLTPVAPVDYLELRSQGWALGPPRPQGAATPSVVSGTPCATASNQDACLTALAALAPTSEADGWLAADPGGPRATTEVLQILVYSRGDEVGALRKAGEVAAFLGTVDTQEEARLLLQAQGERFACTLDAPKSGYRRNSDGSWELLVVGNSCGGGIYTRKRYLVAKDGRTTLLAQDKSLGQTVCGRRPEGLRASGLAARAARDLGAHFAHSAHLEAGSVIAFRRIELELRRFGAPASFVTRAKRARADEINHARDTAAVARRFGGVVPVVEVAAMTPRNLFAFALENAVEGAVRETYGALVAAFQAERAAPELRPLLRRIARDEARHAELAHDIHGWVQPKLSTGERAHLAAARAAAVDELRAAITTEPHDTVLRIAGMPSASEARILLDGLDREILAAA
jgi:hypothetical protein